MSIPDSKNVEFHTYIHKNCRVPVFYDSMVGKLITYGKNRIEAIEKMKVALENIHIDGLATNTSILDED